MICGLGSHPGIDLPDTGGGCCYGADLYGPQGCTCWRPVYDVEQAEPMPDVPRVRPDGMCADCAYRPDSPERAGEDGYLGDPDLLEDLAASSRPFWCHDGIRRPVKLVHPSGAEVPGHPAAYDPVIVGAVPFRADGRMAFLCAGWAARNRALLARTSGPATRSATTEDRTS